MSYVIHWLRRDLRLFDNTALFHALQSGLPVQLVFIFDRHILDKLEDKNDKRLTFIHRALNEMQERVREFGASIHTYYGQPEQIWEKLAADPSLQAVYANRDYEPYARKRDTSIITLLKDKNIPFHHFKDHVIHEAHEVLKDDGKPYTVFTPYSRKWKAQLKAETLVTHPSEKLLNQLKNTPEQPVLTLESMGFEPVSFDFPPSEVRDNLLKNYHEQRNFPALTATSHLGVHLRFGTISIRALATRAKELNETFLNELIWRDFYQMILWHFPHAASSAFKPAYDHIEWRNKEAEFEKWCQGQTGYPIVDAGMRELLATGFMHNRVRMIVASFLTKHLLIDWRWGEAWFARHLLDFDQAANNGGWQWAAGSGCDAAPYFRVFSPEEQTKKFDARAEYIRRWVPEFDSLSYTRPIVDHKMARDRALSTYGRALKNLTTD
jgi:deoxyribodipyrimidine photo-lyase